MTIQKQIDIQWPAVALFNYVCDITNITEWRSEVMHAEWIDRTEDRIGSTFREVRKNNDEEMEVIVTVIEYMCSKKYTVSEGDSFSITIHFASLSEECTRLTVEMDHDHSENHLLSLFLNDLNKLKNILEEVYC